MKKVISFVCIVLFCNSNFFAQIPSWLPTDSLKAWYPFNGNANDESGKGNHGTVNGATLTTDRFNSLNSAYSFDGINDNIFINHSFWNNGWSNFTIAFWLLQNNQQNPNNVGSTYSVLNSTPHNGISFSSNWWNSNKYAMWIGNGAPASSWNVLLNATSNTNVFIGTWNHIVYQKAGSTYKLYINGVLDKSVTNATSIQSYFYKLYLGCADPIAANNEVLDGKLDDFGFWDKELTQQEILKIYNSCNSHDLTHPISQTVTVGNSAFYATSFSATTSYQWQADIGFGYQNLSNAGPYSGVSTPTLTVSNTVLSMNNYLFRCILSNGGCVDTTNAANLTVLNNLGLVESSSNSFLVFPNPSIHQLTIKLRDNTMLEESYSILDFKGAIVVEGNVVNENTVIDISQLASGFYIVKLGALSQKIQVLKD
ncbi:MAG: T9SS type A sorting domain-containing protein [Bacteroidetes bacterium]|nr:T9SS type A sorting domain-containing protein [Bacteroidota bacterium]